MTTAPPLIYIADDSDVVRSALSVRLEAAGLRVHAGGSGQSLAGPQRSRSHRAIRSVSGLRPEETAIHASQETCAVSSVSVMCR